MLIFLSFFDVFLYGQKIIFFIRTPLVRSTSWSVSVFCGEGRSPWFCGLFGSVEVVWKTLFCAFRLSPLCLRPQLLSYSTLRTNLIVPVILTGGQGLGLLPHSLFWTPLSWGCLETIGSISYSRVLGVSGNLNLPPRRTFRPSTRRTWEYLGSSKTTRHVDTVLCSYLRVRGSKT